MKKILSLLSILVVSNCLLAQEQKAQWATISVPQVTCFECKNRLESYLTREKGGTDDAGIIQFKINQGNNTVRVQYFPTRISLNYIQTAIANAGFDADTIKANTDSYKLLPPKCKRIVDGGGPKKGDPCKAGPMDKRRK